MLMKARSLKKKASANNEKFTFAKYLIDDWLSHGISTFAIILYVFIIKRRAINAPDSMYELLLAFSATVGYCGADIVSRFFSATNKRLNSVIDIKSNITDHLVGPSTDIEELIIKGNAATGHDVTLPPEKK